jgi:serine protease AprX
LEGPGIDLPTVSYFVWRGQPKIPNELNDLVKDIILAKPREYLSESPTPPSLTNDHLQVPQDIARDMDASHVHARGITGSGVKIAMVDSGFYMHPYYNGKGYTVRQIGPNSDPVGHGTAIAACALAVSPGAELIMVDDTGNSAVDFAVAVRENPQVITCSWRAPLLDRALQMTINNAISNGIVVLFAAGNAIPPPSSPSTVEWPGSEPEVISVGGAYIADNDSIEASNFARSGTNINNPGRHCPDVCGICGRGPWGIFIALPTPSGSQYDRYSVYNDGTTSSDGWVVFSGTSAATPMVAGVVALMMEADSGFIGRPDRVRRTLINSCIDVCTGTSASSETAGTGADRATGAGLVQAYRAVYPVDVWIKHNSDSDIGLVPTLGRRPSCPPYTHWTSPDIKVFSLPLANPEIDFDRLPETQPVFGRQNYVYVRIRNRGTQASGEVFVRLYYADPSTNLDFPSDWRDGQSGLVGQGSITVNGTRTNLQSFSTVSSLGSTVLPTPFVWMPPDPTTATQTQTLPDGTILGHFCLLGRLETPVDPIMSGTGGTSVICDNNIAMKNVHVCTDTSLPSIQSINFFVQGIAQKQTVNELIFDISQVPKDSTILIQSNEEILSNQLKLENAKYNDGKIELIHGKSPPRIYGVMIDGKKKILLNILLKLSTKAGKGDYSINIAQVMDNQIVGGISFVARIENVLS